jgi:putative colanic acid biosysnthesis UDP-glucose lipid carrier transferase
MNSRFLRQLQITLAGLDLLSINAVIFISGLVLKGQDLVSQNEFTSFMFILSILWLLVSLITDLYHEKNILTFSQFARKSKHAYIYFLLFIFCYLLLVSQYRMQPYFLTAVVTGISVMLMINRFIYLIISTYFKRKEVLVNKVLVIGYNNLSKKLVNYLEEDAINKQVIGYCEEQENVTELSNYPILSTIGNAMEVCKEYGVNEIYSTLAPEHNPGIYQLINSADQNCIRFRIIPDISYFVNRQIHVDYYNEIPVVTLRKEPLEDLGNRIKKRLFDVVVSSLVCIFILSWLIPLMGLLIWLENRGPVFFVQQRSGKNNLDFPCLKFRSMKKNDKANLVQATINDDRITRIGRFMRKTSLDEFPQFINVLKGDMSIVGPRPHMVKHTEDFRKIDDKYMIRHFFKPGITGWAQVNGFRGEIKNNEQVKKRVDYDIWYLENWSLWLDLEIIFLTVYGIFKGEENAY